MNFLKKYKGEIITFFLNTFILLIVFKLVGILDHTIILCDLKAQVVPLFKYLLNGTTGLFNFNFGLGDSFLGVFYYYLSSPFNILIFFIKNLDLLLLLIILLKSSFASLFCYKYLKYQIKDSNMNYLIIFSLLYGLSSYFLSYNFIVQFLDVYMIFPLLLLGIDKVIKENKYELYVISLMLIILFNYYFAYMVCIFVFLYYNYRVLLNKMNARKYFKDIFKFGFISFLACLSMFFVLIPIFSEIGNYSRDNGLLFGGESLSVVLNYTDIIKHYLVGDFAFYDVLNGHGFFIFSSVIVIPLIILFFTNTKINIREKIFSFIMLFILILSISLNYVNYMWHGFVLPCCFNGRFTFMFILFMILIAYKSINNLKGINTKKLIIVYLIIYLLIFLYNFINFPRIIDINILSLFTLIYFIVSISVIYIRKHDNKLIYYIRITLLTLIIGSILYLFKVIDLAYLFRLFLIPLCIYLLNFVLRNKNIKFSHFVYIYLSVLILFSLYLFIKNINILGYYFIFKIVLLFFIFIIFRYLTKYKVLNFVFCLLIIFELIYGSYNCLFRFSYDKDFDNSFEEVINYIKEKDDSLFYRIENNDNDSSMNYSILYNYYGVDYFMSSIKKDFVKFFLDLDVFNIIDSKNSIFYDGSYHLLSSLLNIKYYVEFNDLENDVYTHIKSFDKYELYKNERALEFGYMVNDDIDKLEVSDNGLEYINNVYKTMSGNGNNILDRVEVTKIDNNNYSFYNNSNKDLYIIVRFDEEKLDQILRETEGSKKLLYTLYFNGILYDELLPNYVYKIDNNYEVEKAIDLKIDYKYIDYITDVYFYYYNDDVYKDDINILRENQLEVLEINKNSLVGTIDTNKKGYLFMSCLYNEDIEVYVDSIKQDKVKLLDTFMGVYLEEGEHKIELRYKNKILYISFIPSIIGVLSLLYLCFRNKLKKN